MYFLGNFVLTAAHCVLPDARAATVVRVNDINLVEDSSTDITKTILKQTRYPSYNSKLQYDDIALIQLASDVTFGNDLYPACLSAAPIETGTMMTAIGFGLTESILILTFLQN
jgi:secreted trypsin-like serine protease